MNKSPRFAFFGTPDFSVKILEVLDSHGLTPALIVTAPDRGRGRGQKVTPTPVKLWALKQNISVVTPETLKENHEFAEFLRDLHLDVAIVAAYGLIIPSAVLSAPKHGSINVHPSLLPKYRGASPLESQILADEDTMGVTIIQMDEKMDHGPILSSQTIERPRKVPDALELEKVLALAGGELVSETVVAYLEGRIEHTEQIHEEATYTKKIVKEDALIDLSRDPYENFLKIQAYKRFRPHFFLQKGGKNIRVVIKTATYDAKNHTLNLERVIPEGGKEMPFSKF
ncbi:MAG: methionyl-tRNA formyltransferase [Candidatus Paceibacterota bacterium]